MSAPVYTDYTEGHGVLPIVRWIFTGYDAPTKTDRSVSTSAKVVLVHELKALTKETE
jgi:hypothetical protein